MAQSSFRLSLVTALSLATFALAGCEDTAALNKAKEAVLTAGTTAAPKVTTLTTSLDALSKRIEALPADADGVADLKTKLAAAKTQLASTKTMLDGLGAKADEAAKSGKKDEVDALLAKVNADVASQFSKLETDVAAITKTVTDLEKKGMDDKAKGAGAAASYAKVLSTGYTLRAAADGIESSLVGFVDDASKPVDKTTWFNFDKLTFKTGSADIDMETSKDQLQNMVEIMKAYPKLKLKVGGYTDNTGPADANKKLSQQRADAVKKAMVTGTVAEARIESEGYGQEHPVCAANDTDACKAQNRRIAVRVTQK